jgi:nucleoside-diphosphate-sugar epimerase
MAPTPAADRPCLILGCGYLGRVVAGLWLRQGRRVLAVTRGRADELRAIGVEPVVGDVTRPESLNLPFASTVLYAVGLDRSAGHSMRAVYVDGLRTVLDRLPPPDRFVYVSSTGVYGQTDGSTVDEDSPTEPADESGRVVLDAERLVRGRLPAATVLRFAGLYGPGRVLRQRQLLASEPLVGDADKWLNLVHVADGAAAVLAAESATGRTLIVSDGTPVTRRQLYTETARLLGVEARFDHRPGVEPNRRLTNARLRWLGWAPRFPSYAVGLADALG